MGSYPRFSQWPCERCGLYLIDLRYRGPDLCLQCVHQCRGVVLVPILRKMLRIEPTFQIFQMIDECLFDYTRKPRQLYSLLTALQSSWTQLLSGKPAPLLIQDEDMPNSFRNETARSVVEHRQHVRALHFLPSVSAGTGSLCRVGGGLMWPKKRR